MHYTHRPVNSIWDKEELFQQWKELICHLFISSDCGNY